MKQRSKGTLGIRRLWWGSLPLRVLFSTLALSIVLMLLAGMVLLQQATAGVVAAKKSASLNEAAGVYAFMQAQLRSPENRGVAVHESLNRLADLADAQAAQYRVVIQGPASRLVSAGIRAESVPDALIAQVEAGEGMFVTPPRWSSPTPRRSRSLAGRSGRHSSGQRGSDSPSTTSSR